MLSELDSIVLSWLEFGTDDYPGPLSFVAAETPVGLALVSWIIQRAPFPLANFFASAFTRIGQAAGPPVPPNVAMCLKLRTLGNFRPRYGRVFLPWLAASGLSQSGDLGWDSDVATLIAGAWGELNQFITQQWSGSGPPQLAVWYRSHQDGSPEAMPAAFPVFSAQAVPNVVGSQYRRIPTRGRPGHVTS